MPRIQHSEIELELPSDWKFQAAAPPGVSVISSVFVMYEIVAAAVGGGVGAVVAMLLPGQVQWTTGLLVGALVGALANAIVIVRQVARTRRHLPGLLKGPRGEFMLLWVWTHPPDMTIGAPDERLRPDSDLHSPLGGIVRERSQFTVGDEMQAAAIREAPLEAISDPDWPLGEDVPFSADYDLYVAGENVIHCRLFGVLTSQDCNRRQAYDTIAASVRRAANESPSVNQGSV